MAMTIPSLMKPTPGTAGNLGAPSAFSPGYAMGPNFMQQQEQRRLDDATLQAIIAGNRGTLANTQEALSNERIKNVQDLVIGLRGETFNPAAAIPQLSDLEGIGEGSEQYAADALRSIIGPLSTAVGTVQGTQAAQIASGAFPEGQLPDANQILGGAIEQLTGLEGVGLKPDYKLSQVPSVHTALMPQQTAVRDGEHWTRRVPATSQLHPFGPPPLPGGGPPSATGAVTTPPPLGDQPLFDDGDNTEGQEAELGKIKDIIVNGNHTKGRVARNPNGSITVEVIPADGSQKQFFIIPKEGEGFWWKGPNKE